jgi:hypothetical protein
MGTTKKSGDKMKNITEKISNKTVGKILIWIGVFAWMPYIVLVIKGIEISIWPFLIIHLVGSIGGGKLHGPLAEDELIIGKRRRKASKILIYVGVMAWLPYIYLNDVLGQDVLITPYLIVHLTGVISGVLARLSVTISQHKKVLQ